MFCHVNKVNYAGNCGARMSLKCTCTEHFITCFRLLHNNKLLESSWVVIKVVVKPPFELKQVRWWTKFVRVIRLFEIDVAECNLP